jgi:hypothetical protein
VLKWNWLNFFQIALKIALEKSGAFYITRYFSGAGVLSQKLESPVTAQVCRIVSGFE